MTATGLILARCAPGKPRTNRCLACMTFSTTSLSRVWNTSGSCSISKSQTTPLTSCASSAAFWPLLLPLRQNPGISASFSASGPPNSCRCAQNTSPATQSRTSAFRSRTQGYSSMYRICPSIYCKERSWDLVVLGL